MADDVATLTYEAALAELDAIISQLEGGDVALEAAISAYERGMALSRHCAELLDATEQKVTQLVVGSRGETESPITVGEEAAPSPPADPAPRAGRAEQALFGDPPPAASRASHGGAAIDPEDIPF
ncbi:MAG: exodeoxyribonuclease VII small subunit [Candidatus Dormibacteria bacterium]